jgi:hypothetical protein
MHASIAESRQAIVIAGFAALWCSGASSKTHRLPSIHLTPEKPHLSQPFAASDVRLKTLHTSPAIFSRDANSFANKALHRKGDKKREDPHASSVSATEHANFTVGRFPQTLTGMSRTSSPF